MPPIATLQATIISAHYRRMTLTARQTRATIRGGPGLREPEPPGASTVGPLRRPAPDPKPWAIVASTIPGAVARVGAGRTIVLR